jgi:hypothetical protein
MLNMNFFKFTLAVLLIWFIMGSSTLTPKGPCVLGVDKPDLDSVTWPHFIFRFLEFKKKNASCNKLCKSTNFIIFAPTNQKL